MYFDAAKSGRTSCTCLKGLKRILLDIDKAIKIIRETEKEADVVPNLMIGFGIDQIQAEYVAEIKLRNINREYILKRVEETASLEAEIEDLEDTLARPSRIRKIIVSELEDVRKKYAEPRRTGILYDYAEDAESEEDAIEDYPVTLFLSQHGLLQKDHAAVAAHVRRAEVQGGRRAQHERGELPTPPS